MSDELTDRDRLALAFEELRERDYYADPSMAYRACCLECALHEIKTKVAAELDVDPNDEDVEIDISDVRYVFWHLRKDDFSFVDSCEGFPIPDQYKGKDEDWFNEHIAEMEAVMLDERTSRYTTLINPLNLHWRGNEDEIVDVLRRHGLRVSVPNTPHLCIEVLPTTKRKPVVTGVLM